MKTFTEALCVVALVLHGIVAGEIIGKELDTWRVTVFLLSWVGAALAAWTLGRRLR